MVVRFELQLLSEIVGLDLDDAATGVSGDLTMCRRNRGGLCPVWREPWADKC
jgi:hypothetical protein